MKKVLMVECTYLISRSGWFHVHISLIFACLQMLWRGVRVCVCVYIYIAVRCVFAIGEIM
jgi:hypothetical protein